MKVKSYSLFESRFKSNKAVTSNNSKERMPTIKFNRDTILRLSDNKTLQHDRDSIATFQVVTPCKSSN